MKRLIALSLALALAFSFPVSNGVLAGEGDKVTICHNTGSATNPWVVITVDRNALNGHKNHGDVEFNGVACPGVAVPTARPAATPSISPAPTDSGRSVAPSAPQGIRTLPSTSTN